MNVALVTPPKTGDVFVEDLYEPIGILYLAAYLRTHAFRVHLDDAILFSLAAKELAKRILDTNPALVGMSIIGAAQVAPSVEVAAELRRLGFSGHVTCGGIGATFLAEQILSLTRDIDSVVRCEGEATLLDLCVSLRDGKDWRGTPNLSFRWDSRIVHNPIRPLLDDLDALPFMARDFVEYVTGECRKPASLVTGRGCWSRCVFCCTPDFYGLACGKKVRLRSIPDVIREMDEIVRNHGVNYFRFYDEVFILPSEAGRRRATEFTERLRDLPYRIRYFIMTKSSEVSPAVMNALKETGLRSVCVGIESGSQEQLDSLQKGTTVEDNEKTIDTLKRMKFPDTRLGCMLFEPDSTLDKIKDSLRLFKNSDYFKPARAMNRMQVLPGSKIEARLRRENRLKGDWRNYRYDIADARVETLCEVTRRLFGKYTMAEYYLNKYALTHSENRKVLAKILRAEKRLSRDAVRFMDEWIKRIEADGRPRALSVKTLVEQYEPLIRQNVRDRMKDIAEIRMLARKSRRKMENAEK